MEYKRGDYKSMSMSEKIEFMHQVCTDKISFWGEDYDYSEAGDDFLELQKELYEHPEMLTEKDIPELMRIFDDHCYELSWQQKLSKILWNNLSEFGKDRMEVYLQNLQSVPEDGRLHGWQFPITWLTLYDTPEAFEAFRQAVLSQNEEVKKIVKEILQGTEVESENRTKLLEDLDK